MTPWLLVAGGGLGFSLGVLGAGGSILAVPALIGLAGLSPREAMASGLLTVGATALLGALLEIRRRSATRLAQRLRTAVMLAIPGLMGAGIGAVVAPKLPETALLGCFLAVMLVAAVRLLRAPRAQAVPSPDAPMAASHAVLTTAAVGFGLGMLTGVFGIGGGFLVVPALVVLFRLPTVAAASISLWVIAVNAFAGLVAHAADGNVVWSAAGLLTLGASIGVVPGLALKTRLPEIVLRRAFAVVLLAVTIGLGWYRLAPS
jgi:hypothetical protein